MRRLGSTSRTALRLALLAGALATLGACSSVHPRVWQNGAAMSSSRAYYSVMAGERGFATQRALYSSATPLRHWQRDVPFAPFGRW